MKPLWDVNELQRENRRLKFALVELGLLLAALVLALALGGL